MGDVKIYECTVLIDASSSANVKAASPEEAAELAENEVVERGAGSLCHQCSNHTEVGDVYAVVVYENGEEVLDTDFRSIQLRAGLAREAALQYKADLYDEVWQKATGMGFMNVTMALEQVAALREELAIIKDECIDHVNLHKAWTKQRDDLQQRLTAAEQQNSEMLDILGTINCLGIVRLMDEGLQRRIKTIVHQLQREKITAALKPTESGASE